MENTEFLFYNMYLRIKFWACKKWVELISGTDSNNYKPQTAIALAFTTLHTGHQYTSTYPLSACSAPSTQDSESFLTSTGFRDVFCQASSISNVFPVLLKESLPVVACKPRIKNPFTEHRLQQIFL